MEDNTNIAPVEESKETTAVATDADTQNRETVGEALGTAEEKPKEDTVPLAALLELKKENKQLQKDLKSLKASIEDGAPRAEVAADLKAIAEEHDIDEAFLSKLANSIKAQAEAEIEAKMSDKLKPMLDKERDEKIERAFDKHYSKAIEVMPQYKDLVNREVIKKLSLDPANANKTFNQIIEESYGHLVTGQRTLDSGQPGTSRGEDQDIDYDKASRDTTYFKEIMSNPNLKKKYNDGLTGRLSSVL